MNTKEIGEIKRRARRDRSNITAIHGCYVRDSGEVIAKFRAPLGEMSENEADKYMALFKKTLAGTLGKTLKDISFPTKLVANQDPRHARLMTLRKSSGDDKTALDELYQEIINSIHMDENYLILIGCDVYDVPFKSSDDTEHAGDETFTYLLCAICPVKETAPNLHYVHEKSSFHDGGMMQAVNAPVLGFMFPAFDNRATNIYGALMYTKSSREDYGEFVEAVFGTTGPVAADAQKESFDEILSSHLGDECSVSVIYALHERAAEMVQLHKEAKVPDLLTVDRNAVESLLNEGGVSPEKINDVGDAFEDVFGASAEVPLGNIVDTRHYTVKTSSAVIKVAIDRAQDIEVRTIGGRKYICIPAEEGIEANGIAIIA